MASSGSLNTSSYSFANGTRYLTFSWSIVSQSVENNETTISWSLKGAGTYSGNPVCSDFHVEIDGDVVYDKPRTYHVNLSPNQVVASGKKVIAHNSDGTKDFSVYVEAGIYVWDANCSGSKKFTLDTIPRASEITSVSNAALGNACNVKWTPMSTSFRYKLEFALGDWSYTSEIIHPNTTAAYTYTGYTLPLEVANQLPNTKEGVMTVTLCTYTDNEATMQAGEANSATFTVTVPDDSNTKPVVTMILTPVSTLGESFDGLFIQGKTKVKAELSAEALYGAAIESYSTNVEGGRYGADDEYTSDYLAQYGSLTVYGYAEDSRGYTGSVSEDITVIPYSKPQIQPATGESEVIAARCNADGILNDSGSYLKIMAKRVYSPVQSNEEQKNFCEIRFRYKIEGAANYSAWTTILGKDVSDSDEIITEPLLDGALSLEHTYLIQIQAIDDIGIDATTTIIVPTDKVYCHRDGARRSFTFGGYVEDDHTFALAEDIVFKVKGEKWVNLGLSGNVTESAEACGRGLSGTGCSYRVVHCCHVHVAFNCAFVYAGSALTVNAEAIPEGYRPSRNVHAMCAISGFGLAQVCVTTDGDVVINWVQPLLSDDVSTAEWIDGYIDYFV